jgi:hypothetical protein
MILLLLCQIFSQEEEGDISHIELPFYSYTLGVATGTVIFDVFWCRASILLIAI